MAELVGGAFLSSFLNVLFDRITSPPVLDFISGKKNNNELLMKELGLKLLTANKLVDDAEEKQMTSPNVRRWLDDLKDAIYCVGELLDEINTEALRRQLEGDDDHSPAASSSTSWISRSESKPSSPSDEFHNSLEPKISNILGVLNLILNERDVHGLKEGVQHRPQERTRQTTSRVDEFDVFGREKDKKTILEALRLNDPTGPKIGVLPIVGMGGIGKSTLAQLVYKDVKDDFDVQAWVFVGGEFGILQIAQTIYGKITKNPCTSTDLDLLSEELEKVLTGKKFLFVLDDVWSEDYLLWKDLMTHFNSCGVHGSKIIVTTRQRRVASITWTLSTHYLQGISEDDSWLLFAMHAFTEDSVITAHPYLEVIGRQIVKKCQGLPLAIKSLGGLLHSVLNRREWEKILKSDLWELPNDKVLPALRLSYQYLPPHLKRCFAYCAIFPKGYKCQSSKLISWWMAEDFLQPHGKEALEDVGSDYFDILVSRSFFQHSSDKWGGSYFIMHDLINDLAKFVAGEFCLRLEENQPPNKNLCKTRHFSFMGFGGPGIQKFEALDEARHLHTFLQLLDGPYYGDCNKLVLNYTLVDLKELQHLRGTLTISGVGNIDHEGNALEADIMSNKDYLDELVLLWGRDYDASNHDPENDRKVLNKLRPHTNLEQLEIESYGGLRFPGWLGDPYFSKLSLIVLKDCKHCCLLPPLGQLPSLKELHVRGINNLVEISSEFNGNDTCGITPFRSLQELFFEDMLEWEKWSYYDGSRGNTTIMFPNLRLLELENCPKLTEILHVESECPQFLSLAHLAIELCPNFVCFPDGGMDAPKLKVLYISACKKLRSLPEQMHTLVPSLQKLQVFGCPEVESFPHGGLPSNLQDLSFECCRKLAANRSLWCLTRLNSLRKLEIRFSEEGGEEMRCSFPEEGLLPATLTSLSVRFHPNLTTIQGKVLRQLTSLEVLKVRQCPELQGFPEEAPKSLKSLAILECPNIGCLPGEWLPTSLSGLVIQGCPLLEERFRRETGEDWPKIALIPNVYIF